MNLQITAVIDPAEPRPRMKNPARQRPGAVRQFQFREYSDLGNQVKGTGGRKSQPHAAARRPDGRSIKYPAADKKIHSDPISSRPDPAPHTLDDGCEKMLCQCRPNSGQICFPCLRRRRRAGGAWASLRATSSPVAAAMNGSFQ
jgi:hypothetical protein